MMVGQTRAFLPILRPEAAKEQWYRREEPLDSEEKLADLEFDEEYYAKTLKEIRSQRVRQPIGLTGGDMIENEEDVDAEEEEAYDPHMEDEEEDEEEDEINNMEMEEEEEEEYSLAEMEDNGNLAGDSDEPVEG